MSITVKALQKTGPDQPFRVAEIDRRDPRPDDVVIDIKAAGICHSDIHTIRNEWGEASFPLTVGHEIAGVVSAVGSEVTEWKVGDRVGVGCLVNSCGECAECLADQEQNCLRGNVGTYNSTDVDGTVTQGGYAEKVVVNERFVLRIPDGLDFDVAAPLLCAGITTYSPLHRWGAGELKDGAPKKVAVLGLGGLGHMGVQIAAAMGAEVTVLSRSLKKEQLAIDLGATRMLSTAEEDFFSDHRGEFDLILNTISADIPVDKYLRLLAPRGVMAVVGLPPEKQELSFGSLIGGGKVLAGSNIGGIAETQEMLDFCAEHGIAAQIETIGITEADSTYDRVVAGEVYFRAVIDIATLNDAEVEPAL
ncbi:NAD(P)-dependent alcohol dehydrogenase [Brevibacterium casei]|uniref:alcohol dehydrogenase (NADP(+)) n=1 Tax=Brevibacterium casei TaxID=33889 RepID=A0A269Z906_9MICO|nr:NAD(P)-dependent alcohol dehydrogenase [Brevibacterium casei]MCT1550277.1 NAD(P)-dependent alcohol dehydrogenase [Brevibacterium casei]MCT1559470.1 NAD(P)-dependent alcohol dehydrogenase [Brevibacterium casei]MCT2208380.1 NAD(P)-dependent alcohol dehydrogenase [Brevibacterium casei]PAK94139.1 alcohol dehydrogenase [Brevibacterium casei]VEW10973.1 NADP-dependent alcohol dehydrogenase C [Brevibacterium casei]